MLAAMTSLATVAETNPAPPPFNANFYIVAATVIPVLFLALAVQGRTYENLLKAFSGAYQRWMHRGRLIGALRTLTVSLVAWTVAGTILGYWAVSEVVAIYALYEQQAASGNAQFVFGAVTFMVIMTAAGPALGLFRAEAEMFAGEMKDPSARRRDIEEEPEAAEAQEATAEPPPPAAAHETGKTDPEACGGRRSSRVTRKRHRNEPP